MSEPGSGLTGWLRRPPTKPAGPEVKALFQRIASDPWFHQVAGLSEREVQTIQRELASAEFCYCNSLQGGYAGRPPGRGLVLGLSRLHRRVAPAAHELFHLAREVRGRKALNDETAVWREERIVWFQTFQYVPFRGTLELAVLLGILGACVYGVLEVCYRLLDLGGVIPFFRRLLRR
jgi:hypothetical protein